MGWERERVVRLYTGWLVGSRIDYWGALEYFGKSTHHPPLGGSISQLYDKCEDKTTGLKIVILTRAQLG